MTMMPKTPAATQIQKTVHDVILDVKGVIPEVEAFECLSSAKLVVHEGQSEVHCSKNLREQKFQRNKFSTHFLLSC